MQTARGHTNKRRHRAVDAVAKSEPLWIEIVQALPNESRVGWKHGGGLADHAVAFLKAAHAVARFRDDAGEFMSENDRKVYRPALRTRVLVEIAAANADGDRKSTRRNSSHPSISYAVFCLKKKKKKKKNLLHSKITLSQIVSL